MFARLGCALLLLAATAPAQEYGRTSSGELRMFTKQPSKLSASLGFNFGAGKGFEGSLGGTLIEDKMWFFASAIRDEDRFGVRGQDPRLESGGSAAALQHIPQSFLNLRYTGILSPNSYVTATISKSK